MSPLPQLGARVYTPATHPVFVIVYLPRTGSNLLAGMLDSHPEVLCHHELFNAAGIHRSLTYKNTNLDFGTAGERNRAPYAFLRRVFSFTGGKRTVGFKIAPGENNRVLLSLLLNRRVRKVVLGRRGWLHAYTSALIAQRTKVWSIPTGASTSRPPDTRVRIDLPDFRRFVRKRRLFYGLVRVLARIAMQPVLFVDYEDLGKPESHRRILEFLGVDPTIPMQPRTIRQNSPRLRDRIEDFEAVKQALTANGLARFLEEDERPVGA